LAAILLLCITAIPVTANIVPNAEFEQGDAGMLALWDFENHAIPQMPRTVTGKQNAWVTWDTSDEALGKGSLKLSVDTTDAATAFGMVTSPHIPIKAGYKYDFDYRYKAQGLASENKDRTSHCGLIVDLFFHAYAEGSMNRGKRVGSFRQMTHTNSIGWTRINIHGGMKGSFTAPPGADLVQVRVQLTNSYPNTKATAWVDDIRMIPQDPSLPNAGMEVGTDKLPDGWQPYGAAVCTWDKTIAYSGKSSLRVADAPEGLFTGWSTVIPIRMDRKYTFGSMIKGGDINPNGFIGGGALCMQFLDSLHQPVGEPVVSNAIGANRDWTRVTTQPATPPNGAVFVRLTAGLSYCRGTAWFDDLSLDIEQTVAKDAVFLTRQAMPSADVTYAKNLLKNGDVEQGDDQNPIGWTYHGQSAPNWTDKQIDHLHTNGRPDFSIGRGQGQWSRNLTYQGKGALLNISIDPPLSSRHQWYGRNPVDGYWLSDPMPCEDGKIYQAGAWLRPGEKINGEWYGPLMLKFYGDTGRELDNPYTVRTPYSMTPPNEWAYWVTLPWKAPAGAKTMRLYFGQEIQAAKGGWGRTYADNLAVWEYTLPLPDSRLLANLIGNTSMSRRWLSDEFTKVTPPYMPAPERALAYETCWGETSNIQPGNLFDNPDKPIELAFAIQNILGEDRKLSLKLVQTDWTGEHETVVNVPDFAVKGYARAIVKATLPATRAYGSYHLEASILEDAVQVGRFDGRYAVLPQLTRKHTTENIWGVTSLTLQTPDENPAYYQELGHLMQKAGFGLGWVRVYFGLSDSEEQLAAAFTPAKARLQYFHDLGIHPILQLCLKITDRPLDHARIAQIGQRIATEFKGLAYAYGNWGIEQSNSASPYRGGGNKRVTDPEYDSTMATLYDAIKSVTPEAKVLIGNIATDHDGRTVRRLYGTDGKGKFDGAIINAYMGPRLCIEAILEQFTKHGDNEHDIYYEEQASQRSPFNGEARRYGEAEGAFTMVRTWLDLAGSYYPRLKAVSMWGFDVRGEQDIMMVTPTLQPRPQYVAHAVMSDTLADAVFEQNISVGDATIFKWKRSDGPLLTCWTQAGQRVVTFEAPRGQLVLMDIMGNRKIVKAVNGVVPVTISTKTVYILDSGNVLPSKRLTLDIKHATEHVGKPQVSLTIHNNQTTPETVQVQLTGPVKQNQSISKTIAADGIITLIYDLQGDLPVGKRSQFEASCTTPGGGVFATSADLNFAFAAHTQSAPALDGTWSGWEEAAVLSFGDDASQIRQPAETGETYDGHSDLLGRFRLLWDDAHLYLGVEALDNSFLTMPERSSSGFMADSIEFAVQPDHLLKNAVPYYEYEMYLPMGEHTYAASRRFPLPGQMMASWKATVKPTGERGNAVYQVALPWQDLGVTQPKAGRLIAFALVLNDKDNPNAPYSGGRCRIKWFDGVDGAKSPAFFGDVILANR
jgi:hypothetical protein